MKASLTRLCFTSKHSTAVFLMGAFTKLNNNWISVLDPNIFPKVTPPNSKGQSCKQSPLCCLFQDLRCIWHEHPLPYNTSWKRSPTGTERSGASWKRWIFFRTELFSSLLRSVGKDSCERGNYTRSSATVQLCTSINSEQNLPWPCGLSISSRRRTTTMEASSISIPWITS